MKRFETHSAEETQVLGRRMARHLEPGDVIALSGELGAGKTTLIQGIMKGLGVEEKVQSPSFVLVRTYRAGLEIKHVDLYRLAADGVDELHLEELYDENGLMLVEWAERADYLPGAVSRVEISFSSPNPQERSIEIHGPLESRIE